jgi:hypothetical protein
LATKPEAECNPKQRTVPKKVEKTDRGRGGDERKLGGIIGRW